MQVKNNLLDHCRTGPAPLPICTGTASSGLPFLLPGRILHQDRSFPAVRSRISSLPFSSIPRKAAGQVSLIKNRSGRFRYRSGNLLRAAPSVPLRIRSAGFFTSWFFPCSVSCFQPFPVSVSPGAPPQLHPGVFGFHPGSWPPVQTQAPGLPSSFLH